MVQMGEVYMSLSGDVLYIQIDTATATAVISHLRISNNGELKEI